MQTQVCKPANVSSKKAAKRCAEEAQLSPPHKRGAIYKKQQLIPNAVLVSSAGDTHHSALTALPSTTRSAPKVRLKKATQEMTSDTDIEMEQLAPPLSSAHMCTPKPKPRRKIRFKKSSPSEHPPTSSTDDTLPVKNNKHNPAHSNTETNGPRSESYT